MPNRVSWSFSGYVNQITELQGKGIDTVYIVGESKDASAVSA
jgi:hypothetical protein